MRDVQYKGGYVKEPEAGIHKNILVFDFRSLLPSIIITHNISPETLKCSHKECRKNKVPDFDIWFCLKKKGKIPESLEKMIEKRKEAKKLIKKLKGKEREKMIKRERQLKLAANIQYGMFGFKKSSHYSIECAKSIASFGRYYIKSAISFAGKQGLKVIYSDTDSLFAIGKTNNGNKFLEKFNKTMPGMIKLEYEGKYKKGLFVSKKTGEGTKKKYALLDEKGKLVVKGFEFVRGDWCLLAKKMQEKVLKLILNDKKKEAVSFVKKVISDLQKRKMKKEELVINIQLTKPLEEYKNVGPHVAAARKMKERGNEIKTGSFVEFIITKGEGSISERAEPAGNVKIADADVKYYIGNQIVPAALRVLSVFGVREEDLLGRSLKEFMKKK